MRRPLLALALPLLLVPGCGGGEEPAVPPGVQEFEAARDALLSSGVGSYTWTVDVKAMKTRLLRCSASLGSPSPLLDALEAAEAYGLHRGDASQVDVDVPAALALELLGAEESALRTSDLLEEDLAPAVVVVVDGRITEVTINGAALAKRLDADGITLGSQLQAHAELTVGVAEFDDTDTTSGKVPKPPCA